MRLELKQWYDVPTIWPYIEPAIAEALGHGGNWYLPEDIRQDLMCRRMALWLVMDGEEAKASIVLRIVPFPRAHVCELFLIAGIGIEQWAHLLSGLEEWARARGCTELRGYGRLGWKKVASSLGFEFMSADYRKSL